MTTFEGLLIEIEENSGRRRRQRQEKESPENKIDYLYNQKWLKDLTHKLNLENHKILNPKKINSNYDLEEIFETIIHRNQEYNLNSSQICTPLNTRVEGTLRDQTYFQTSARMILGFQAEPKAVETLREALRQFQKGFTETQFGTEYLSRFLKQSWVISDKPAQNRGRKLHDKLLGRVVKKQVTIDRPTEHALAQQEQVRELSREELAKYGLRLDVQLDGSHYGKDFRNKYFDAPFNFCLTYEGRLIASVGFVPDEGRVFVQQIQGKKGSHERLSPFKWERALVNYVTEWAQKYGIKQISVTSVDNNKWAHRHGHLDVEQGRMLYDVTAKRSGFKRGKDGDYHRYFGETQKSVIPASEARQSRELCLAES